MDDIRLIEDRAEVRIAQMEAQDEFTTRLARGGLTVLPEFLARWWPLAPQNAPVVSCPRFLPQRPGIEADACTWCGEPESAHG